MPLSQAKVKSVSSGNSLVLASINNPTQERILNLAFVSAPRLRKEGDEPYAFQSRDFLRRLVVGKVVQFQVLYTVSPAGSKTLEFGQVKLSPTGPFLPELVVEKGWVKLRDNAGSSEYSEEANNLLEKLKAVEARAKANSEGLWGSDVEVVETTYDVSKPEEFLQEWKGQSVDAIIERVLTGDRLVVRLLLNPTKHQQIVVLIAGIRAPMSKRANPTNGKEQPAEEGGEEARMFVEERLLQRTVKVKLVGITPQTQLVAVIEHPTNGSIAPHILKAGLARCLDFHSTMLGGDMATLRQAERFAKENHHGLFKGHVGQKANGAGSSEATVSRVQSADTIYVRNKAGVEKRISLSSIRQPKPSEAGQVPFVPEAKEFLRKKVIGKHVSVQIDATRPATEGFEAREMATVTFQNKNVALMMVENGWASVIRHRRDDDDRSPIYDELLAAEEAAQKEKKGMWAGKPPTTKSYADASESVKTAKIHLSVLQRQKRIPAVVDFVKSGSRFTMLIPRENVKLTLVLSGIRSPRSARNANEKGEPFGQEAHDFAVKRCNQRDVEVDIENVDKVGGFIGTLYVNRENFARTLVEEGLATVHAYSAEQSGNSNELFSAEKRAKEGRKGIWMDWDPSKDDDQEGEGGNAIDNDTNANDDKNGADDEDTNLSKDYRDVVITNIDSESNSNIIRLKLQQIGTGTAALEEMMSAFQSFHLSPSNNTTANSYHQTTNPPKAGEYVAARYSFDKQWYRGRIRHNDREKKEAEVIYIDYGNSEKLPWTELRPLSQSPQFSTQKLKPQAIDAMLSLVQFPMQKEYLDDAKELLGELTGGGEKKLVARVDYTSDVSGGGSWGGGTPPGGVLNITLFDPTKSEDKKESINSEMIRQGLAMVPRKLKGSEKRMKDMLTSLKMLEEEAKKERRGIWEYGDLTED
ncbi:MAG: sedoheptulose-7-phosphate:D-glyceraldehyde-3- phosphate transaldolase [Watsoniomyces obsoletus]|nr:MAG: sedoheptulose-7-phosphate:D-glyceraldehyde-3- phosphate transaldolase [Watsoniomyces obsoletus]